MFSHASRSGKALIFPLLLGVMVSLGISSLAQAQGTVTNPPQSPPLPTPRFQHSLATQSYTFSSLGMFTAAQDYDEVRFWTGERLEPFAIAPDHQGAIADLSQPATIPNQGALVSADTPKIIRVMRQGRSPRMTRIVPMTINNYRDFNLVQ
ncbi:hypothetical protein VB712_10295 [Spirulina sp. CCNP1310]|uniref:hypothetical protein n=1 Tax=Spirulina sp. CCNP1310 TaxID=3110249 RepID=UPI002B20704C|nr:hypothetical protein [Spirulina sp. CCNP1310]MEA5419612.1 hypothetical protein [Spirulina sp. CCNP1310]